MLSPRSALLTLLIAATLALPAIALPRASRPAKPAPTTAARDAVSQPESITQIVEIDDRFYTVEVTVTRILGGAPLDPNIPITSVSVRLSSHDDPIADGLHAVGVRFEKLRGTQRFSFIPVYAVLTGADFVYDEDTQLYHGEYPDQSDANYLRAVVRLELNGRVIKVNMGIVRVNTVILP